MKVKLLKKIRKRFDYKFTNENKFSRYVLIDKKKKNIEHYSNFNSLIDGMLMEFVGFFTTISRRAKINKTIEYNKYK